MRAIFLLAGLSACALAGAQGLSESLETASCPGMTVPYVLDRAGEGSPRYMLILFPGGDGIVNPRRDAEGRIVYRKKDNFLLRARSAAVDEEFAAAAADSTTNLGRFRCLASDLKARFPSADLYLIGTSRGTRSTMSLAPDIQDVVKGVIHTSSLSMIADFDTRKLKNRQLIVHHRRDGCEATDFESARRSAEKYGTDFIAVDGGTDDGPDCQPFSHHGFAGMEREVVDLIKAWIRQK
ncbi:MAG: hypothetical protein MR428_01385 [Mesosutterella sp.]|nr:hypothetical protein [Mesosutterella sp.]